jgi:hypothetical protein
MDFHAIKVMQKKIPPETAWINALKELIKGMKPWCTENIKMGLSWKVGGQDAKPFFESSPLDLLVALLQQPLQRRLLEKARERELLHPLKLTSSKRHQSSRMKTNLKLEVVVVWLLSLVKLTPCLALVG